MDLLVVYFQIADTQQKFSMWRFSDEGKDIRYRQRDDTWGGSCSLHGEGFTRSSHTISKYCTVVPFHDPPYEAFRSGIIDLGVLLMSCENIIWKGRNISQVLFFFSPLSLLPDKQKIFTVRVITALFSPVGDNAFPTIQCPFSIGSRCLTPASIRANPNTDNNIAFRFLGLRIGFCGASRIVCFLVGSCAGRIRTLGR